MSFYNSKCNLALRHNHYITDDLANSMVKGQRDSWYCSQWFTGLTEVSSLLVPYLLDPFNGPLLFLRNSENLIHSFMWQEIRSIEYRFGLWYRDLFLLKYTIWIKDIFELVSSFVRVRPDAGNSLNSIFFSSARRTCRSILHIERRTSPSPSAALLTPGIELLSLSSYITTNNKNYQDDCTNPCYLCSFRINGISLCTCRHFCRYVCNVVRVENRVFFYSCIWHLRDDIYLSSYILYTVSHIIWMSMFITV